MNAAEAFPHSLRACGLKSPNSFSNLHSYSAFLSRAAGSVRRSPGIAGAASPRHSWRRERTGSVRAALMAWKLTVIWAIRTETTAARRKIDGLNRMR